MQITDEQQKIYNLKKAEKILEDNSILESGQKKKIDDKIKEKKVK